MTEDTSIPSTSQLREVVLTNANYHTRIQKTILAMRATGAKPTVRNLINTMRSQGNGDYFDTFKELKRRREESFGYNNLAHELSHLIGHAGHTPQQELFVLYVLEGMKFGNLRGRHDDQFYENMKLKEIGWRHSAQDYQDKPVERLPLRDRAVYFALGLYMRQKFEAYVKQGHIGGDRAMQEEFCSNYAKTDHAPDMATFHRDFFDMYDVHIEDAPAELLDISREPQSAWSERLKRNRAGARSTRDMHGRGEWDSIVAVATGLCEPEDTDYPGRLGLIKQQLVENHLFYDVKRVAALRSSKGVNL